MELNGSNYSKQGDECFEKENYSEALKLFEKAIELEPNNGKYWMSKGRTLRELENFEEALKCYTKGIELEPNNVEFWIKKGHVLRTQENFEKSLECYTRAVELEPNNSKAYAFIGMVYNLQRKHQKCLEFIEKAIQIDPENSEYKIAKKAALTNIELEKVAGRINKMTEYLHEISSSMEGIDENTIKNLREIFEFMNQARDSLSNETTKNEQNNYYEIMGLSRQATLEDIKKRFRELCLKVHPDKEPSVLIQQTMLQIIEAYETLKDVKKREIYDDTLD